MEKQIKAPARLKRVLLMTAKALLLLFIIFSIIPYLLPLRELESSATELVYDNSSFATANELIFHYRYWPGGDDSICNVLLVHGFGASTFSWRYTAPFLADRGYNVYALDLPGFGLSDRQSGIDHSSSARAANSWAILEELAPNSRWHLVGHSMGGATAAEMALLKPDQVESLTLAAGAVLDRPVTRSNYIFKYPPVKRWARFFAIHFFLTENRVEQLLLSAYGRQPSAEEREGYYRPLTISGTDLVLTEVLQTGITTPGKRLSGFDLPVLCIWGEDDHWVPLEQGREAARIISGAELEIIPGEGHCPMETAPDQFNDLLLNFLQRVNPDKN
ncbi:MAG: alpha/beta hydrolase [Bacillota bacterium]|nr:alpha/beta hydrolase [Bacillota bacterium]